MKKFIILGIKILAVLYVAIKLIFFPDKIEMWFIRVTGFLFLISVIDYILQLYLLVLKHNLDKEKKILSMITLEDLEDLTLAYKEALKNNKEIFIFNNEEILKTYAKYLIEHLNNIKNK